MDFVERLEGVCRWFKVGMELYYAAGNQLVEALRSKGFEVFLDLKLHDIPNTVAGGVRSVGGLGLPCLRCMVGVAGRCWRRRQRRRGLQGLRGCWR